MYRRVENTTKKRLANSQALIVQWVTDLVSIYNRIRLRQRNSIVYRDSLKVEVYDVL